MKALLICHIWPVLKFDSEVCNIGYNGDIWLLESVLCRWTQKIKSLDNLLDAERLSAFSLFSVSDRLLRADLLQCWETLHDLSPFNYIWLLLLALDVEHKRSCRGHVHELAYSLFSSVYSPGLLLLMSLHQTELWIRARERAVRNGTDPQAYQSHVRNDATTSYNRIETCAICEIRRSRENI